MNRLLIFICSSALLQLPLSGQAPVAVGSGSYASFPPSSEGLDDFLYTDPIYVQDGETRPIPTNDWWTDLVFSQYAGQLWAYPLMINPDAGGFDVHFPNSFTPINNDVLAVAGPAITIGGQGFSPPQAIAADWSDWSVVARMESGGGRIDATLVRGSPFAWFETEGLVPTIGIPSGAVLRDDAGVALGLPFTGSRFTVEASGRVFGIHLPAGANVDEIPDFEFLQLDFGSARTISRVIINWETAYGKVYAVETSNDGQSWTAIASENNSNGGIDDFNGLGGNGRYLRLRLIQQGTQFPFSIFELQVFDGATLISPGATATASSVQGAGLEPDKAVDGDFGTRWAAGGGAAGEGLIVNLPATDGYLVVSALPSTADLAGFDVYARNIPRQTRLSYDYDIPGGTVSSNWSLTTESLDGGAAGATLQGFLPHHYKDATVGFGFEPQSYPTLRGAIRLAAGTSFDFDYRFNGILPHFTAPFISAGEATPYDPALMYERVTNFAAKTGYGADTYFGGKELTKYAHHTLIAKELNHQAFGTLKAKTREALVDWLTYTPGETEHYYAWYDRYKALVGFNESFGSGRFTDHHFHYGYLVHACALYAIADPDFLDDYGEMIKLVLREYAEWDRDSTEFPWFRAFEPWVGHSYAGGISGPTGNNQESTSEAVQSWIGMYILGDLLGDDAIRDAGAFGYLSETRATLEYWFDRDDENQPAAYNKSVVGILFDEKLAYATFFSGEANKIHGIQFIPPLPGSKYFAEDPAWALTEYQALMAESLAQDGISDELQFGNEWALLALGMRMQWDPAYTTAKLNGYHASSNGIINDELYPIVYYFAHALQNLGLPSYGHTTDFPLSTVHSRNGRLTTTAYNPSETDRTCTIYDLAGTAVGSFTVPARSLATFPANPAAGQPPAGGYKLAAEGATASSGNGGLAVDGNPSTRWESDSSDPQFLQIDYGQPVTVNSVSISWENASAEDYRIEGSLNGVDWFTIRDLSGQPAGARDDTFSGLSEALRYLRIFGTARTTASGYSIFEVEVFGSLASGVTPPEPQPLRLSIARGTLVSWSPPSIDRSYQPQKSDNGIDWLDLGPAIAGDSPDSVFDAGGAPEYRVLQAGSTVTSVILNGGFETAGAGGSSDAQGWSQFGSQAPERITTDSRSGAASMQLRVQNDGTGVANTSLIQQRAGGVVAGNSYDFSFWARQVASGVSYVQEYSVLWFPAGGGPLTGGLSNQSFPLAGSGWQQVSVPGLTAPAGATSVEVQIIAKTGAVAGTSANGEVRIDDLVVGSESPGVLDPLPATAADGFQISWNTRFGVDYQPLMATDLTGGFSPFGPVVTGDGTPASFHSAFGAPAQYFRVDIVGP